MKNPIYAIWFDIGGTLKVTRRDPEVRRSAILELMEALNFQGSFDDFDQLISSRYRSYKEWCNSTLYMLSEEDLWVRFLLPDYPEDFVRRHALAFNKLRRSGREPVLLPGAVETIHTLYDRGYRLFVISNTTSSIETPNLLEKTGLVDVFEGVLLSITFGRRKPHPSLFIAAARQMNIDPANCVYVGNDLARDLVGARQAGLGGTILIDKDGGFDDDLDKGIDQQESIGMQPDARISSLSQLLELFPPLNGQTAPKWDEQPLYDAALSTMWGVGQPGSFNQTFIDGRKAGFARFELNHRVTTELIEQFDHDQFYIASVHEPCPTTMSYEDRKQMDITISNLEESKRVQAVDDIKRSIDTAIKLGSRLVVIHPGAITCDRWRDDRLRVLFRQGHRHTSEYQALLADVIAHRETLVHPHLEQALISMQEIVRFSTGSGINLGLENRYRYYDIPLLDEMEQLLAICDANWYGFQYDVGHAHTLDVLGLVPHFEWLERFSSRMVGVHFHDVIGITDHQVPGQGDVDFTAISRYIPDSAQITLEIGPKASLTDLAEGLQRLVNHDCIKRI
ncbi:MAG TPA: HAD-IA family hydrolase [Brevefilum fermentans]|jgi:HAD superfamily hydrolase (TIGR01549 family)|nr:HAD-IA family hydrolase [Brevefilum fermentans]HQA28621.1 HAD-IA family hydrolase [Brevefilum fermentans]